MQSQTWNTVLRVHPAADIFPCLSDSELATLADDIKRHGQQVEVALHIDENGVEKLLDGRNRLSAMERLGLPIIKDGELNRDAVRAFTVPGNVDPYDYVLSANVHRRHLSAEQKRDLIEKCLKANPKKSNRQIAKEANDDHKKVGRLRKRMESTGALPRLERTIGADGKSRKQPVRKANTKTAVAKETKPVAKTKIDPEAIEPHLNALIDLCEEDEHWPDPTPARRKRRAKVTKSLRKDGAF
jgi:hypothetical protein